MNKFYDMEKHGVTQSLISMWLSCRQKARLYLQGWDSRYHRESLIYGSIGHGALELAYTDVMKGKLKGVPSKGQARRYCDRIEDMWRAENVRPNIEALKFLETSLALVEKTIPVYFDYWREDFKNKQWLSLEEKFELPFSIKWQGKTIIIPLRGKKDGVFKGRHGRWLLETKFKSLIDEGGLLDTLSFETQVMLYLFQEWKMGSSVECPRGALYNVVRRTSLRRRVDESVSAFATRVWQDMEKRPEFYFIRMESPTDKLSLKNFEGELRGIIQEMYAWWKGEAAHYKNTYSCIGKYGKCVYLPVCANNDFATLAKRKAVFKELEETSV